MKIDDFSSKDTTKTLGERTSEGTRKEEPLVSAAGAAAAANEAINETARKYLTRAGIKVDPKDIQNQIHDGPLFYLGVAAGAGFIVGGGLASKWGLALLGLAGRRAATETATNLGRQVPRQATGGTKASA
ncbi:MAG TPA: hypothetical protein VHY56_13715 [Candidatus Binataceae bacterium]|nr:hypothetical protein [Candidatus Binataceae bacterium]